MRLERASARGILIAGFCAQVSLSFVSNPAVANSPYVMRAPASTMLIADNQDTSTSAPNSSAIEQGGSHQGQGGFKIVRFPSGSLTLCGALFKPKGDGPFPTMIYNHGSEKSNGLGVSYGVVGRFYKQHGFVVLVPLRRGHTFNFQKQPVCTSDGVYFNERLDGETQNADPHQKNMMWIKEQEVDNEDVEAAVSWLKTQPFVDKDMMLMSGISFGGIQTVLASEKGLGIKAFIPFAPGAMSWAGVPELHDREKRALENAKAPIFLIQAENDYNTGPSEFLGKVLDKKGGLNRHKLYPPYDPEHGHAAGHGGFATKAEDIWSPDVFAFMKDVLGPKLVIKEPQGDGQEKASETSSESPAME